MDFNEIQALREKRVDDKLNDYHQQVVYDLQSMEADLEVNRIVERLVRAYMSNSTLMEAAMIESSKMRPLDNTAYADRISKWAETWNIPKDAVFEIGAFLFGGAFGEPVPIRKEEIL